MVQSTNEDLGTDNLQETGTEQVIIEEPSSFGAESVDSLTEVTQDGEALQVTSDSIDGATDAVDNLCEMQDLVQQAADTGTGNLSEVAATSIETTLESIMYTLGTSYTVPSLESVAVGDRATNMVSTLESAKNSILDKAIKGLKVLLDQVLAFIQNLVRNSWVLNKLLEKAKAKASDLKGKVPAIEKMETCASTFSIDGHSDKSTIARITQTAFDMMSLSSYAADEINKINFTSKREGEANAFEGKFVLKDGFEINTTIDTGDKDDIVVGYLTKDRGFKTTRAGMFEGHRKAFASVVSGGKLSDSIDVASIGEIDKCLKNAGELIKEIQKFDSKRSVIKNAVARISAIGDEVANTYGSLVSKASRERVGRIQYIRTYRSIMNDIIGRMPMEAYKIAHGLIQYAGASAGHYKPAV